MDKRLFFLVFKIIIGKSVCPRITVQDCVNVLYFVWRLLALNCELKPYWSEIMTNRSNEGWSVPYCMWRIYRQPVQLIIFNEPFRFSPLPPDLALPLLCVNNCLCCQYSLCYVLKLEAKVICTAPGYVRTKLFSDCHNWTRPSCAGELHAELTAQRRLLDCNEAQLLNTCQ